MNSTSSSFRWFVAIMSFLFLGALMFGGYNLVRLGIENAPVIAVEPGAVEALPEGTRYYGHHYGWFGFGFARIFFGLIFFFILFKLFTLPFRFFFWRRMGWGRHRHHGHWGPPWKQGRYDEPGKWVWVPDDAEEAEPYTDEE